MADKEVEDDLVDYDEEEEDFFNGALDDDIDPFAGESLEKPPMSGSAKAFWGLAILTLVAVFVFAMQDRVQPIELIDSASAHANWHRLALNELPIEYTTKPIEQEWKLEIEDSTSLMDDIAKEVGLSPAVSGKAKFSGRKINKKDKKRVAKFLKEAQDLKNKGGGSNWRKAAGLADKALAVQPVNLYGLLLSASIHMELANDRDALSRLQKIMQLDPSYGNKKSRWSCI